MIIMVMDGQGGGVRTAIIKGLLTAISQQLERWALGTNSIATSRMMKAGANRGPQGARHYWATRNPHPQCHEGRSDTRNGPGRELQ